MDTLRRSTTLTTVVTANGEVQTNEEAQVYVQDLDLFVTVQLLKETPAVLSLGKLCSEHGCSYEWKNGETPQFTKDGNTITCTVDNFVPLVVPGLSLSSSSCSASTSKPKDQSNSSSESEASTNPITTRSAKHACGKPMQTNPDMQASGSRGLAHTENEMDEEDPTQGIPDWSQPFTENLEDLETHVPAHSSAREISESEGRKTEAQYLFSLPQRPNLRHMLEKNNEGSVQKTQWGIYSTSRKVWWLDNSGSQSPQRRKCIPEQSPIRCRGRRSRHSIDTILSVQNQEFAGDGEESTKVSRAVTKVKISWHWQFIRILPILWRIIMESSKVYTLSLRNKRNCRTSFSTSKRGNISCIIAIWIGW